MTGTENKYKCEGCNDTGLIKRADFPNDWAECQCRRDKQREMHPLGCSFCGKTQKDVKKLIAGPNVFICDECIDLCVDIMVDEGYPLSSFERVSKLVVGNVIKNALNPEFIDKLTGEIFKQIKAARDKVEGTPSNEGDL